MIKCEATKYTDVGIVGQSVEALMTRISSDGTLDQNKSLHRSTPSACRTRRETW